MSRSTYCLIKRPHRPRHAPGEMFTHQNNISKRQLKNTHTRKGVYVLFLQVRIQHCSISAMKPQDKRTSPTHTHAIGFGTHQAHVDAVEACGDCKHESHGVDDISFTATTFFFAVSLATF